jgi:hypothetical protein
MFYKVKIKKQPKARTGYQVQGGLVNDVPAMGGADYNSYIGAPDMKVNRSLTAVPREDANLEAEGGETVMGNIDGSNIPSFYTIQGPRHANGGVPLNLPDDSFIFSDTKSMKISDPTLLKMFGLSNKKGGYTPAEMSKKYDINKYRQVLQDPDTDKIARKTAEIMIKNAVMKLGALALAQESKKGFPQGIPAIAKPYMEANQIPEEDLVPKEEAPQQQAPADQMSQGEEGVGPGQEMPMNMPNGEPVAMPEEMPEASPEQMMEAPMAMYGMSMPYAQYGGIPMADYGMTMGGFDFPYYPDEMAYGGVPRYDNGGGKKKAKTKEQLEKEYDPTKHKSQKVKKFEEDMVVVERDGKKIGLRGSEAERAKMESLKRAKRTKPYVANPAKEAAYVKNICNELKNGAYKGRTAKELADANIIAQSAVSKFTGCENISKSGEDTIEAFELEETPTTSSNTKKKCQCPDPMNEGKWIDVECPEDGSEPDCEEVVQEQGQYAAQQPRNPKWWLQDTVNTMGAFGDLMRTKKYMPWEARVDLEEPRPTFLDPTRELAAQSEQANIASQAAAQFAGPQALNARLAAIQGQGAASAANTLSNINNQNVNIANQFEANQVGVRNQENMLNQQMTNRVFDKNVIANQQFDNAITAGRAKLRDSYNTGLTNRAKTDAMNQMYPNYQVDPTTGGLVNYTPTDKTLDPGQDEMTAEEYANSISEYDPKIQQKLMDIKFGKRYGGQLFEHGGYVYSTFPMILL